MHKACKGGGGARLYSLLSTTHGHITDCKVDSVVYTGVLFFHPHPRISITTKVYCDNSTAARHLNTKIITECAPLSYMYPLLLRIKECKGITDK